MPSVEESDIKIPSLNLWQCNAVFLYLEFSGRDVKAYEHYVVIDDELRLELVERRDMLLRVVSEGFDPGLPERCDPSCPYLRICNPENPNMPTTR
jgi:CRISPR-associated protein Csa1